MSRYSSICIAIEMVECVRKMFDGHVGISRKEKLDHVIQDLQRIGQDIRYGGQWAGAGEETVKLLELCMDMNCKECMYKSTEACKKVLKEDAAMMIRNLSAENRRLRTELQQLGVKYDELFKKIVNDEEQTKRQPAPWQKEIMESGGNPPEKNEINPEKVEYDPMKEKE